MMGNGHILDLAHLGRGHRAAGMKSRESSPEERLPGLFIASLFTPIGTFWFALTARPDVPYFLADMSGIPIGMGVTLLQLCLLNYYIDLYPTRSASVVAAHCLVRDIAAAVFPSLAVPLYSALGIWNASVASACVGCVEFPMGVILLAYGERLRACSRWEAQDPDRVGQPAPTLYAIVAPKYVDGVGATAPLLEPYVVRADGGTSSCTS